MIFRWDEKKGYSQDWLKLLFTVHQPSKKHHKFQRPAVMHTNITLLCLFSWTFTRWINLFTFLHVKTSTHSIKILQVADTDKLYPPYYHPVKQGCETSVKNNGRISTNIWVKICNPKPRPSYSGCLIKQQEGEVHDLVRCRLLQVAWTATSQPLGIQWKESTCFQVLGLEQQKLQGWLEARSPVVNSCLLVAAPTSLSPFSTSASHHEAHSSRPK